MMSTEALIFLSFTLIIASLGAAAFLTTGDTLRQEVELEEEADVDIINVIGQNITNSTLNHVRISIKTDDAVKLDDGLIILRVRDEKASLQYRNGTLTRNIATGFYTQ